MNVPMEAVAAMLAGAGLPTDFQWTAISGGGNNRVYRVRSAAGSALLKVYFRHPDDPRDRCGTEYGFLQFAWACGLRCVPRPIACNEEHGLGLYEYVDGRRLAAEEVGSAEIGQAIDFYGELNRFKGAPAAGKLPRASEACFSIGEHLACVERRLARLMVNHGPTSLDADAQEFIRRRLNPAWQQIRAQVMRRAACDALDENDLLAKEDWCLSPSDFGFHNAILTADGRLRFIDFEYAGWDDPAKTVCDFFCQPAVPVPEIHRDRFADAVLSALARPEVHRERISWLWPIHKVKWICILLNDFLPVDGARRSFAREEPDVESRKSRQLAKAREALSRLER